MVSNHFESVSLVSVIQTGLDHLQSVEAKLIQQEKTFGKKRDMSDSDILASIRSKTREELISDGSSPLNRTRIIFQTFDSMISYGQVDGLKESVNLILDNINQLPAPEDKSKLPGFLKNMVNAVNGDQRNELYHQHMQLTDAVMTMTLGSLGFSTPDEPRTHRDRYFPAYSKAIVDDGDNLDTPQGYFDFAGKAAKSMGGRKIETSNKPSYEGNNPMSLDILEYGGDESVLRLEDDRPVHGVQIFKAYATDHCYGITTLDQAQQIMTIFRGHDTGSSGIKAIDDSMNGETWRTQQNPFRRWQDVDNTHILPTEQVAPTAG